MSALVAAVFFAQTIGSAAAPARSSELQAIAALSPRQADCGGAQRRGAALDLWSATTRPKLTRYCDLVARGYAALNGAPDTALRLATEAERVLAGLPSAELLRARALSRLGKSKEAFASFERLGIKRVADAAALFDYARAAARSGALQTAVQAYRLLVSRLDLLPNPTLREQAYIEAAIWVMQLGPGALDEAAGYLSEARRRSRVPGLGAFATAALALALDRQGHTTRARALASEVSAVSTLEQAADPAAPRSALVPELPREEYTALLAIVLDAQEPALAANTWQDYVELAEERRGVWIEHAQKRRGKGGP